MRRRSRASGEPTKAQRRKTVARKTRVASKTARARHSSAPGRETKVARLTNELNKTRQQRTATRRSTFALRVVVDTLVRTDSCATRTARAFTPEGLVVRFLPALDQTDRACSIDQPDMNMEGRCDEQLIQS